MGPAELLVPLRGDLRRHAPDLDEALRERLVVLVALVVGGEVVVVERGLAATAVHDGATAVHRHPDVTGDVLLGLEQERVEGVLQRREPEPVVDQLAPALLDLALEPREVALDGDVLELLVRRDERDGAGSLVDLAALDADEPVLDHVEATDALRAGT